VIRRIKMKKQLPTRRVLVSLGLTAGIAATIAVLAADLNPAHVGTTGVGTCTWHFVNNQTDGAAAGTLTATFDIGTCTTGPRLPIHRMNQQFFCFTDGEAELLDAFTNLPGTLQLSDLECVVTPTTTTSTAPLPTTTTTPPKTTTTTGKTTTTTQKSG
jgi:hypothetical protein